MFKKIVPFIFLLLVGCATHKATFVPAQPSDEKGSAVYFYRSGEISNLMISPVINIKNAEGIQTNIGKLNYGEYRLVYLLPGQYEIKLDTIKYYAPGNKLMIEVKPGTVHYLRLDASLKFETGLRYKPYERKFDLQKVEEAIALGEIASCTDVESKPKKENRPVKTVTKGVMEEDEEAHFTTDKTSDPFSRNR